MSKGVQLSRIWYLLAFLGSLIGQAKETKIICTSVTLYMYLHNSYLHSSLSVDNSCSR